MFKGLYYSLNKFIMSKQLLHNKQLFCMNQLSFFKDINKKEMRRPVVKELKNYKGLCGWMKKQGEPAQAGNPSLFLK